MRPNTPMKWDQVEEIIASKNFYYAQGLGRGSFKTVILAENKKQAEEIGRKWQQKQGFTDLHLYRNNYKPEVRSMLFNGNYYDIKVLS